MADKTPYQKETPFLWFLFLSVALNTIAALSGYYFKFPEQKAEPDIELTTIDTNDVPPLGEPDAAEPMPAAPEPIPAASTYSTSNF